MLLLENKDFREFVELLNSNAVKFLVVGGHAVGFHGHPRFTGDLDIWIATDPDNAARVARLLEEFGFGSLKLETRDFTRPGYAIQLGRPPYRIDILTSIDGVDFPAAYRRRVTIRSGKLTIPFIALGDLLANKRAAARAQDLADVENLVRVARRSSQSRRSLSRARTAGKSRKEK